MNLNRGVLLQMDMKLSICRTAPTFASLPLTTGRRDNRALAGQASYCINVAADRTVVRTFGRLKLSTPCQGCLSAPVPFEVGAPMHHSFFVSR